MAIPSHPVPSLANLAFQKLCETTEETSKAYYQGRQVCSISQHQLSKSFSLLERLKSIFFTPEHSPASIVAQRLSSNILLQYQHPLSYRILCEVDKKSPSASTHEAWQKLFQQRWPKISLPQYVSAKTSYLIHDFLDAFVFCGDDFRKIAKDKIALFVENADTLDGIELDSFHPEITDELLLSMASFMPNMKTLIYKGLCKATSKGICSVVAQAPQLEHLSCGSTIITRALIRQMAQKCQHLKTLELPLLNDDVSLEDLFRLISANPYIESLSLSGAQDLTNENLIKIIKMLPCLKILHISRSPYITGEIFDLIFTERGLEKLSFSYCPKICDATISDSKEYYSLNELRLSDSLISEIGFQRLKDKFPYIKLMHIH